MLCPRVLHLYTGRMTVIAWIGGFTALLRRFIAVQQNDIKRILAYSTLSQPVTWSWRLALVARRPSMFT